MRYKVEEVLRNEVILNIAKDSEEFYTSTDIVSLVEEIDSYMPSGETLFKVTIEPVQGYIFEKYFSLGDVKDVLEEYDLMTGVEIALADKVKERFKDKIEEIKKGTL